MKLVKFALCLAILIALTKTGYSANPVWKPLTDPGHNADEVAGVSPDAKRAPLSSRWYDVRSSTNPCVKGEPRTVMYHGNKSYKRYQCKTHSLLCVGPGNANGKCNTILSFIPELNESVASGCECL